MLQGRQTWIFSQPPALVASAAIGGKTEQNGPLAAYFDRFLTDNRCGRDTFEQAEQSLLARTCRLVLKKAALKPEEINFFLSGDLLNQTTSSGYTARALAIPYLGVFAACSTVTEGLALAAQLVSSGQAERVLAAAGSHNCAAEKQFRYPTEYGAQKPPCSQYTATAAGAAVVAQAGSPIRITAATLGRVVDLGVSDPWNMGGAMAPAACDTLLTHLRERQVSPEYYDLIVSGDLGRVGSALFEQLLAREGVSLPHYADCGCLLYDPERQSVFSGGSGPGCAASVLYGYLCHQLLHGNLRRILLLATGALLSPVICEQNESIPAISHAVALEVTP